MKKSVRGISKLLPNYLSYFVVALFAISIIAYVLLGWFQAPDAGPPSIDLALICSILGGFALAGAATTGYDQTLLRLRRIGAAFFLAAVSFVVLEILSGIADPASKYVDPTFFGILMSITLTVGALGLAAGVVLSVLWMPRLFRGD